MFMNMDIRVYLPLMYVLHFKGRELTIKLNPKRIKPVQK